MDGFGKIIKIFEPSGSHNSLNEKMQTLKRNCETLRCREADVNTELEYAESSSGKKRRLEVENWLTNVESIKNKVTSIDEEVRACGFLGSLQLVSSVENLTKEVAGLMAEGKYPEGLTLNALENRGVTFPTTELVGQAFQENLEIIWGHLMKPEVLNIGIWGMGGVGKTAMVTHIHNRVQKHAGYFRYVYWVTVAQNSNISRLQDDITKELHYDFLSEVNEMKRAAILSEWLTRRKRCLLILDDVWNDICLEKVGVPLAVNGCKLIVTTRSLEVCRRLGCDEKIKVQPLGEEEAWDLFVKNLRCHRLAFSPEVIEVAKCVTRECAGLPLGIVTVARCMRGVDDICDWNDALRALRESKVGLIEMEEEVFQVLKFSYSRLNDPKVQQCFMFCALYPEDHMLRIENLIQSFIDEGLIERMRSRQEQFDKGHAILNKLVNSCLLEPVKYRVDVNVNVVESVRMHDLVRDMAIKMSPRLMVKAGMHLYEMPDEAEWSEDVERVSLMNSKIQEIRSDTSPLCPQLITLFLSGNSSLKRIQNTFFQHMPSLQVLNLSDCREIKELPGSVSNLKNLSALVVRGCWNLKCLPSLAELKCLKRLDLFDSGIHEVPHGLERLVNLTYLDFRVARFPFPKVFPTGILPNLSRLEYLRFDLWKKSHKVVKIKGEELRQLKRLSTFQGRLIFDNVNGFLEYVMSRQRYRGPNCSYYFVLCNGHVRGRLKQVQESYSCDDNLNQVTIVYWNISKRAASADINISVPTLEALLKDVQSLIMEQCNDARSLCDISWLDNATNDLKRCKVRSCESIERVGSYPTSSSLYFLQTLEKLQLEYLKNLSVLFELEGGGEEEFGGIIANPTPPILQPPAPIVGNIFSRLAQFCLRFCPKIKKLFRPWFMPNLQNLEVIEVSQCEGLEEIIEVAAEEEGDETICSSNLSSSLHYTLPNLRTLSLEHLPKLKSICAEKINCASLCEIKIEECPTLRRIPLSQPPSSLRSITIREKNGKRWWESVQWDDANAKNLLQPFVHIENTGFNGEEESTEEED